MAKTKAPIKGFLIDPEKREITEVEHNGDYKQIYELIGAPLFTIVYLDKKDCIYVDDEGLLKDPEFFFTLEGYGQPLANRGLVLGTNRAGDSADAKITIEELRKMVGWQRLTVLGFKTYEGTAPFFGKEVPSITTVPVFAEREPTTDELYRELGGDAGYDSK